MAEKELSEDFKEFWAICWRKDSRDDAVRAFDKAISRGVSHETIMSGSRAYSDLIERENISKKFQKLPATWLNKGCYHDATPQKSLRKILQSSGEPNLFAIKNKIYTEDLRPLVMEEWRRQSGAPAGMPLDPGLWWRVAQRFKQAWDLASLRAGDSVGTAVVGLQDAEREFAGDRLPEARQALADAQGRVHRVNER